MLRDLQAAIDLRRRSKLARWCAPLGELFEDFIGGVIGPPRVKRRRTRSASVVPSPQGGGVLDHLVVRRSIILQQIRGAREPPRTGQPGRVSSGRYRRMLRMFFGY